MNSRNTNVYYFNPPFVSKIVLGACAVLLLLLLPFCSIAQEDVVTPQNAVPVNLNGIGNQKLSGNEAEKLVGAFLKKNHIFKTLQANVGASDEMIEKFQAYYADEFNKDRYGLFRMAIRGKLNADNFDEIGTKLLERYTKLYTDFQNLGKNIIANIEVNKKEHKPTAAPLPGPATLAPGPCVSACDNTDFETGTLSGWQACWTNNTAMTTSSFSTSGGSCSGTLGAVTQAAKANTSNTSYQVSITSGAGNDPLMGNWIPVVCPTGGTHSVEIGDGINVGALMGRLKQTFTVTAANANYIYMYAVVLEDPAHAYLNQPYFDVTFYDQTGAQIGGCGDYAVVSQPGLPAGWKKITDAGGNPCYGKKWTEVYFPLNNYIGQCVTIQVEVADCSPTAHFGYAYFDATCSPGVISSSPVYCGQNVTLTAPAGAASYSWSGPCISGSATGQTVTVTCAGTYSCTLVSAAGPSCSVQLTSTLPSSPPPTVVVAPNPSTVCSGSPVSLTASGATTYTWTPTTGLSASTGATVTASPGTAQTYTVTGATGSCSGTATATVNVNTTPTLGISGPVTICPGGPTTLTGSGAATYTWTPNTSINATTGATVTATPGSTITYTLNGSSAAGCNAAPKTVAVTVNPTPTLTISGPATICAGGSTTLTGGGASTYTWTPGGMTGSTVSVSPGSTQTYTLNGTSASGCGATTPQTVVITVNPNPTLTISGPATICSGNPTTLTGGGASTYTWTPNTSLTASTGSPVTATPVSTITYTLNGKSAAGCSAAPLTEVVTVNTTPTLGISGPASICAGGNVTLTGSGASTYTWTPNTSITATTGASVTANPGSTITYTLNGTSAAGCPAAGAKTVVVTVSPSPVLGVAAGSPTICSGGTTTLTGSNATTYTWSPSSSLSASTGSTVTANPTVTTTYTLTGTASGCAPSTPVTVVVTVNAPPVVSVFAASPTICSGATTNLTASNATTYTWTPSGTLSASTGSVVTASPTTTTTYTVTGTAAGCSASTPATVVVTVNPTPTLSVSAPPTICSGTTTTLTGSGATTYTWTPNTGLSASTGASVTANPGSTITYTLTGSSAAGCAASASKTVVVTVNTTPTLTISAPPTICSGSTTTLTGGGASTYTWTPNTSLTASTGASVTASPGSTITYTLHGTSAAGCAAVAPQTVVVTVNPTPTVSLPVSPTICPGGSVNLTASGATTYTWTPNTSLSASTGATVTSTPVATITYTVTGTSTGCNSAPKTVVVTVASTLSVTLTPASPSICSGGNVLLSAGGAASYVWTPNTALSCTTCASATASPVTTITYTVVGTSGSCKDSAKAVVTVNPTPTVSIALTGISAAICPGDSMGMIASGATTYTWTPNTGLSCSTCTTINAGPSVTTTYTLTGTDAGGCTATATQVLVAYPVPVMTINLPKDSICSGNSVTLVASGVTSYSWSPPTGLNTTLGDSVIATPTASTVYVVTGTGTGGCKTKDSSIITVNITPTVSVVPPTPVICSGDSIELKASGAANYQWLPNSGLQCNTCDSTKASPASATTYSVVGISLAGCKDTSKLPVAVNATPTITISVSNGTTICSNKDTTQLTASSSGGTIYTWSPGAGLNDSTGAVVDANPTTTVVYTVSTTSAAGCPSKDSVTIAVNPTPTVSASAVASTICNGTSTTLNASGATTYTWIPNTGLSPSTGATVTASPGSTQTYSVIGMTNGCPDTVTVPLTVVTPPAVTATVAGGDSLCSGLSKTITASGASSYTWKPNGQTTDSIVVAPTTSTTYTVVGSNGTCTDSAIVSLGVYPPFTVSVANDTLCSGRTATITAIATGGSAPYTYAWSNNLGTNSTANILVTPGATTYTCNVSNACGQTFPATVVVDGAVTPNAHFTATPDTIPGGQFVGFINSNSGATSWIWTMGDESAPINGDSSIVYQYTQPGTYWIKLVVSNGYCTDTSIEGIFVTQGIFVPNVFTPNGDGQNDVFHVTVAGMKVYHIEIFNRWGERIFQADSPEIDWDGTSTGGVQESDGDYYYMINATDFKNTEYKYHGYIQLIRN